MEQRMDAGLLWARASIVGLLAFGFGLTGHVMAAGLLASPALLAMLLVMSVLFSVPLLTRPAGRVRMMVLLMGGQAGTHLFLTLTAGHIGDPVRAAAPRPQLASGPHLPVVDGHRVGSLFDAYRGTAEPDPHAMPVLPIGHLVNDLSAHAPMMVVHLAAAALVGLWLAHGEQCLWMLLALTGRRLPTDVQLTTTVGLPSQRLLSVVDEAPSAPRQRWHVRPYSRRGPPLLLAA